MRYLAFATDYDGTLAHDGKVSSRTLRDLERVKNSGRKLLLVTGRELPDLERVFPEFQIFDRIVAENGALIFNPETNHITTLAERPPERFIEELKARKVSPISVGHVIVATWNPHETV